MYQQAFIVLALSNPPSQQETVCLEALAVFSSYAEAKEFVSKMETSPDTNLTVVSTALEPPTTGSTILRQYCHRYFQSIGLEVEGGGYWIPVHEVGKVFDYGIPHVYLPTDEPDALNKAEELISQYLRGED